MSLFGRFVKYKGLTIWIWADRQMRMTEEFLVSEGHVVEKRESRDMDDFEYLASAKRSYEMGWFKREEGWTP